MARRRQSFLRCEGAVDVVYSAALLGLIITLGLPSTNVMRRRNEEKVEEGIALDRLSNARS